jgi:uncharacterized membrane protein YecN with MAPEG domain
MAMTINVPVVTMLYAALCGVLLVALALNVVRLRLGRRIPLGMGEGAALEQPVRVHGNFTEYAPTFLILLLLAELGGASTWFLHLAGAAFLIGRLLHAYGLSTVRARSFGRFYGSAISWTSIMVLSGYLLFLYCS